MSLELPALILDNKAVDAYFATNASTESMKLTASDWELLESVESVLEVCLSNILCASR